jgi:cystathionine gamma-synthase/methionine-gamma-lyase
LRVRQQCDNAARIAAWLSRHAKIARVNYPGLPDHPGRELARQLFGGRGFGGMLSFEIAAADQATAFRFMEALELCLPVTTLGDVYTMVLHPATSSHRGLSAEERERVGIADGLVRLSLGIEEAADIIADLEHALAMIR